MRHPRLTAALAAFVLLLAPATTSLARLTDAAAADGSLTADTLAPPTALTATGGSSVLLGWTPTVDTYATGYRVFRGAATGGPYTAIGTVTPGSASTMMDTPTSGTWYYLLRATYQGWSSVRSNEASATVVASVQTAFAPCAAASTAADSSGAGDNDGYESNPGRACVDDESYATDAGSGTGGDGSCGTGATPDPRKDRHRFWGFAIGLPGSVSSIDGITVRADVGMNNNGGTTNVCVQLSWDGGTSWTTMQSRGVPTTGLTTVTFGASADTWGRSWTPGELAPASFRVRVIDAASQTTKQFRLDYLAVSIAYTP